MNRSIELVVYEGAMCCSSGVCGPEPDRELINFSEALKRLENDYKGELKVERELIIQRTEFMPTGRWPKALREKGLSVLPIVTINGENPDPKAKYPRYAELRREIRTNADTSVKACGRWAMASYI